MELVKEKWTKKDILEFQKYLETFKNDKNRDWCVNLLKTELPVLCMKTADIKAISKKIKAGNFIEFLDFMVWDYYENTSINGSLICSIKDFEKMKHYLDIYSSRADNWATCDLLSFNICGNEDRFFDLVLEYIESDKPFVRRIGMSILFNYIDNPKYIDEIFVLLDKFSNEEHYYVNMMNAWLLCECFIKQRDKTLKYLGNNKLNKWTLNKGIQKCRESNRVTLDDKEMLLKYKVK